MWFVATRRKRINMIARNCWIPRQVKRREVTEWDGSAVSRSKFKYASKATCASRPSGANGEFKIYDATVGENVAQNCKFKFVHLSRPYVNLFVSDWRFDNLCGSHLTLKMASAQVVETSVANNSPSQDSNQPYDLFQSRYNLKCLLASD